MKITYMNLASKLIFFSLLVIENLPNCFFEIRILFLTIYHQCKKIYSQLCNIKKELANLFFSSTKIKTLARQKFKQFVV